MVSLGCPKNQVDAEQMLGVLAGSGFEITSEQTEADVIVVNTCGFIESAKEESIEAILEAARMKKQGKCAKVIIAGCLAQRYKEELLQELPEADVVIGTGEIGRISEICEQALAGKERAVESIRADHGLRPSARQHHAGPLPLPQDRRGMQQPLFLLRHSAHPRELHEPALPSPSWTRRAGLRTRARRNSSSWPRIPRPTGTARRISRCS